MRRAAAMLAAALAAVPGLAPAEEFICRGHDPVWELSGRDGRATLVRDKAAQRSFVGGASELTAEGVVVWRGRAASAEPELVAIMLRGACTDPTAGEVSGYLGILSGPQGAPAVGCCTYGKASAAAVVAAAPAQGAAPAAAMPPAALESDESEEAAAPPARRKPGGLTAGASARIAGPSRRTVNLRGGPSVKARVIGRLPGGRAVVVQQISERDGQTWYRVRGRGVPANAWVRGDMLLGG